MATNPNISLGLRPLQTVSPLDRLHKAISIADMVSQLDERNQMSKLRQSEIPLRQAEAQAAQRKLADEAGLNTAFDQSATWNNELGDVDYDMPTLTGYLQSNGMSHLIPVAQAQVESRRATHRQRGIDEADAELARTKEEGQIAENFLSLDEEKRATGYADLRKTLVKIDPSLVNLPTSYDPSITEGLQKVVAHRRVLLSTKEQLQEAQNKEQTEEMSPEGLQRLLEGDKKAVAAAMGVEPDRLPQPIVQGLLAARKKGFRPAFAATQEQKISVLAGKDAPDDAETRDGEPLPAAWREEGARVERRRDPTGRIFYEVTTPEKKTAATVEHERVNRLYAFKIGKQPDQLTPADEANAEVWHKTMDPKRATEVDKRIALYYKDPKVYADIFGHGNVDKVVTGAQKATIIGRINNEIARQGLLGDEAKQYREERLTELKDAGVEIEAPKPQPPAPKPSMVRTTNKRAGTIIDPAGKEHRVTDVDAAIKLHPGTREKK